MALNHKGLLFEYPETAAMCRNMGIFGHMLSLEKNCLKWSRCNDPLG
jgi:hypothetical protein